MNRLRGFEVAKGFENSNINLPVRSTAHSAGYDFECAERVWIPSIFVVSADATMWIGNDDWILENCKPTLVKTGIKAYMQEDEALFLYNRSSNPFKKRIILANSVGVVDSDYYSNVDNDGHIMFAFYNLSADDVLIEKGERIGQGIFQKFLKTDNDITTGERTGGLGSTN